MSKPGYVIKDEEGRYSPAFLLTNEGWMYLCFTGVTTGFSGFLNEERAEVERTELEELCKRYEFNKSFSIEQIDNIWKVLKGELIIENISMEVVA